MGLLDDAIREHLDLKRRRGADPAEVARLEHEALGPVRREPAPTEAAAEEQHDESLAEPAAAAEQPHPAAENLGADEHARVLAPEDRHEPPHGDPLFEQHAHNGEMGGAAAKAAEPATSDPEDSPAHASEAPDPAVVDQATTEYHVEDHDDEDEHEASAAHAGPEEDVLEETPDFLQETPEHDRLWFEQRPPRDFDFDG
jgi:hypothetical protein